MMDAAAGAASWCCLDAGAAGAAWVLLLVLLGYCLLEEEMRFVEDWRRLDTTQINLGRIIMKSNEDE